MLRCGWCVHRNARTRDPIGDCSAHGARRRGDPVCDRFFDKLQLSLAAYGKTSAITVDERDLF